MKINQMHIVHSYIYGNPRLATTGFKEILAPLVQNSGRWWKVECFLGVILKEEIVFHFLVFCLEKKRAYFERDIR